jgi:hypothetical protein
VLGCSLWGVGVVDLMVPRSVLGQAGVGGGGSLVVGIRAAAAAFVQQSAGIARSR